MDNGMDEPKQFGAGSSADAKTPIPGIPAAAEVNGNPVTSHD